jgi:hypothetical protein
MPSSTMHALSGSGGSGSGRASRGWRALGALPFTLVVALTIAQPLAGAHLAACSVPVYYYGLMRWTPSDHRIVAPAGALLPEDSNGAIESNGGGRLTAYCPGDEQPWWDKPLSGDAASAMAQLTSSPLRQEIAKRLSRADTAVWILIDSGDAKADAAAEALLKARCDLVVKAGNLPNASTPSQADGQGAGEASEMISPLLPPRIAFSILHLAPVAPAEEALRAQLLSLGPGLKDEKGPLAVAVFGRGHALPPLYGPSLIADGVDAVCLFLIGSCSCEIKDRLPGRDLLLTVDWNKALADAVAAAEAKSAAADAAAAAAAHVGSAPASAPATSPAPSSNGHP